MIIFHALKVYDLFYYSKPEIQQKEKNLISPKYLFLLYISITSTAIVQAFSVL